MQSNLQDSKLRILLDIWSDPGHERYEQAWREFDRRYSKIILGRILTITTAGADVSDICQSIMEKLMTENFKALRNFRARDSEAQFKGWLNVIARREAIQHIKSKRRYTNLDEEMRDEGKPESRPERKMHETWVPELRKSLKETQKKEAIIERHIFVYLLRKVFQFKAKEVEQIPLLDITAGNIDNVINRLNIALKNQKK